MFTESLIPGNVSAWFLTDAFFRPSQWFMALEPRHPILYETMTEIVHNLLNIPNVLNPKVVFVTGPAILNHGYKQFLTPLLWTDGIEVLEIFNEVLVGKQKKTVMKVLGNNLSDGNLPKGMTSQQFHKFPHILTIKKNYSELVAYNATLNMTRHERIVKKSGVLHWTKHIYKNARKNRHLKMTCRQYLKWLEKEETSTKKN
eukprot:scaffold1918_cov227-Chaetoceros_neogracile.AAC.1